MSDVTEPVASSELGDNVRGWMKKKGLTVKQVADGAEVTETHLYRLLRGQGGTKPNTLQKLAKALQLEPGQSEYSRLFELAGYVKVLVNGNGSISVFDRGGQETVIHHDANAWVRDHKHKLDKHQLDSDREIANRIDKGHEIEVAVPGIELDDVRGEIDLVCGLMRSDVSPENIGIIMCERIWAASARRRRSQNNS